MSLTMASLFDGSGGFPLAASLCGIKPVWASEVEPYPIAVTRQRFPQMEHLGDVSKIHGGEVEPVDIITFGSPCQDMSIAGKRAGIKNENAGDDETTRSGLFHEAARIIKEMREATNGRYPRYAVWENVPGAFSSNKGEDFRLVLQTLIQIVEPTAVVPPVPKAGWSYYDCWMGDGWSVAYRTVDAQYWGVPQRRRRIYLVLDLGGQRAGEILFEREGLRRDFKTGRAQGQGTTADAAGGAGVCDCAGRFVGSIRLDNTSANPYGGDAKSPTIATGTGHGGTANIGVCIQNCLTPWDYQSKRVYGVDGVFPSLQSGERSGQNQQTVLVPAYCLQGNTIDRNAQQNGSGICEDVAFTLNAVDRHGVVAPLILDDQGGQQISVRENGVSPTLRAEMHGHPPCVVVAGFKAGQSAQARSIGWVEEQSPTLAAEAGGNSVPSVCVAFAQNQRDEVRNLHGVAGALAAEPGMKQQTFLALAYDARGNGDGKTSSTITGDHENRVTDYTTVVCIQGAVVGRSDTAGPMGPGYRTDGKAWTLDTKQPSVICMATQQGGAEIAKDLCPTITAAAGMSGNNQPVLCMAHEQPIVFDKEVYNSGINATGGHYISEGGPAPTLRVDGHPPGVCQLQTLHDIAGTLDASYYKGPGMRAGTEREFVAMYDGFIYIVRRLTPTECARLQGFPEKWGDVPAEDSLDDMEDLFWLEVRQTYDAINGRPVKDYTTKQILSWYNKLHTDSAEYKMWGNGIALPCALYVMEGIAHAE